MSSYRRLNNNQNEMSQRNRDIYEERESGTMIIDLAKKYSLSIPRVHRICTQEEVKVLREKNTELENRLNSCNNILRHKTKGE